jgi:predicted nucleic acid-binding protein
MGDGSCEIVRISEDDWRQSSVIASRIPDQTFSIGDRTSFAAMERLGITQAVSFDDDFVIYRYGQDRAAAFEVLR